MQNTLNQEFSR